MENAPKVARVDGYVRMVSPIGYLSSGKCVSVGTLSTVEVAPGPEYNPKVVSVHGNLRVIGPISSLSYSVSTSVGVFSAVEVAPI